MQTLLGIDLGTSSIKAMLLDTERGVIGIESQKFLQPIVQNKTLTIGGMRP